ncbi:MAG TPA: type II secretion system F family protein [Mycobacteriales bacterium]|nr:type II secretion system F family protein [Mycobacteriales bacterium]
MTAVLCAVAVAAALVLVPRDSAGRRLAHVSRVVPVGPSSAGGRSRRLLDRRGMRGRQEAEVAEVVFALAAELRAGRPPGRALALVASCSTYLRRELSAAATAVEAGASAATELRQVAQIPGCAGLRGVAAAWEVTESAGGAVADVLERLGEVLDVERQNRADLDAALAAPRATMLLLAALPVFGLALGQSLGARPLGVLFHRPLGWAMLATGAALDGVGVAWTRLLVRRALR